VKRDELDRLLADDERLLPSSGFVASVMEQVQRDAFVPPALPFPWTRALPGFVALAVAIAAVIWTGVSTFDDRQAAAVLERGVQVVFDQVARPEIAWTALAVVMTIVPAMLALRLMRPRA
jgi:hypothetical protein